MNIKVRNGAFETNSSSSHSIVLKRGQGVETSYLTSEEAIDDLNSTSKSDDEPVVHDGILDFTRLDIDTLDDFGWGIDAFTDFSHKMLYAIIDSYHSQKDITDENSVLCRIFSFLKEFLNVHTIIYPKCTEADRWDDDDREYYFGSIDHQSQGTISELRESGYTIKEFLLNKNFVLYIDNDNH